MMGAGGSALVAKTRGEGDDARANAYFSIESSTSRWAPAPCSRSWASRSWKTSPACWARMATCSPSACSTDASRCSRYRFSCSSTRSKCSPRPPESPRSGCTRRWRRASPIWSSTSCSSPCSAGESPAPRRRRSSRNTSAVWLRSSTSHATTKATSSWVAPHSTCVPWARPAPTARRR